MDNSPSFFENGLLEIPLSTFSIFRLQLPLGGGGYFRLFPYQYFKSLFKLLNRKNVSFVFYLHPWELDPSQPKVNASRSYRFRHYVNIARTEEKLNQLLADFEFEPLENIFKREEFNHSV
jgi:hypothetical protein